jgi:hypothetical protein
MHRGKLTSVATKHDLMHWTTEALSELGGEGSIVDVCQVVWRRHEHDLRASGNLFYTWQYDIRWAAQKLRDAGQLEAMHGARGRSQPWRLSASHGR